MEKKMIDSKKFRTRQEFLRDSHPALKDYYIIGMDAGYSGMKGFHEKGEFCFPSYAKKLDKGIMSITNDKDIFYQDLDTNEIFLLGYTAQQMLSSDDTNDMEDEIYGRKRYGNQRFQVLCNAALAIALMGKEDDREVVTQTGLPAAYVDGDSAAFKTALTKPAHFALKMGNSPWKEFHWQRKADSIFIMPQPAGSLYSVLIQKDGTFIPGAMDFLCQNNLIVDIGFGTLDLYGMINRFVACVESANDIGMRSVLERTAKKILEEYSEDIRVSAIQKNLESGKVLCIDEENMSTEYKPIAPLLEAASREVFLEVMKKTKEVTKTFRNYNNVIMAGGTGEAWMDWTKEYLKGMQHLNVIPSNVNDGLPMTYSNVRGYYMYRYTALKK